MVSFACSASDARSHASMLELLKLCESSRRVRRELSKQSGIDLSDKISVELVDHYIDKIHDRPHSLFHAPTLRGDARRRSVSRGLMLVLCSMGCRFSSNKVIRSFESSLTAESKRIVQADLENICVENIPACILIANICAANANPWSEALFFSV